LKRGKIHPENHNENNLISLEADNAFWHDKPMSETTAKLAAVWLLE